MDNTNYKMGLLLLPTGEVEITSDTSHLLGKKILHRSNKGLLLCGKIPAETEKQQRSVNLFVNLVSEFTQSARVDNPTLPLFFYTLSPNVSNEELLLLKYLVEDDDEYSQEDEENKWLKQNLPLSYYVRCVSRNKELAQATDEST